MRTSCAPSWRSRPVAHSAAARALARSRGVARHAGERLDVVAQLAAVMPRPASPLGRRAAGPERAPEHPLRLRRGGHQLGQVHARVLPHLVEIETRSSVATFPGSRRAAPAAAELPNDDSNERTSASRAARAFAAALAARVVEVGGQLDASEPTGRALEEAFTWRGFAMPVVSPKATSSQPASASRRAISSTRSSGTSPS